MKRLIVSCDDLGITEEINLAVKDCAERGVVSSSSVVANGEFYEHAINNVVNKSPIPFYGLHLNLTEGKAINKNNTNLIADENNVFKISAKNYFLKSFYEPKRDLKNAVYNELKSQIQKVIKDGIKLSHFDSHEHVHHSPWIFKIVTDLGKEFGINKIRFVNEKIILKNYLKDIYYKLKTLNYIKHLIININNRKIKNTFLSTDYFFGVLNSGKIKLDEFSIYLDKIDDNKSIEVCIHPSEEVKGNNKDKKNFYSSSNRKLEKELLISVDFKKYLDDKGIKLINFSDLN